MQATKIKAGEEYACRPYSRNDVGRFRVLDVSKEQRIYGPRSEAIVHAVELHIVTGEPRSDRQVSFKPKHVLAPWAEHAEEVIKVEAERQAARDATARNKELITEALGRLGLAGSMSDHYLPLGVSGVMLSMTPELRHCKITITGDLLVKAGL